MKVSTEVLKLALGAILIFVVTTAAGTGVRLAMLWPGAAAPPTVASTLPPYLVASLGAVPGAAPAAGMSGAIPGAAPVPMAGVDVAQAAKVVEFAQIAGILTRMRPVEAAVLMNHLADEHCVAILSAMSVRDCASILEAMPPDRGASLRAQLFGADEETGP
jgi:MgtE intracellular N domain